MNDYKNDVLIWNGDINIIAKGKPIYDFLPKVKALECEIVRDYRANVNDSNTPKLIKPYSVNFVNCNNIKNIKIDASDSSSNLLHYAAGSINFLCMRDVHIENCEFICSKLMFHSTKYIFNKCKINTKIFRYYSAKAFIDFKQVFNDMLDRSHSAQVYDMISKEYVERECGNVTKINATINNKFFRPSDTDKIIKFKDSVNLMKSLELDGCKFEGLERILFEDNNVKYEFVCGNHKPNHTNNSSTIIYCSENETMDGWKLYAYKKL